MAAPTSNEAFDETLDQAWKLADQGRYGAALALIDESGDTSARAAKLRGILSFHLGRDDESLQFLRRAVFLTPEDGDARRWLALVWARKGNPQYAAREHRNAELLELRGQGPPHDGTEVQLPG